MTYAIFSDLHASEDGLALLLKHTAFKGVDRKVCLGDIINAHEPKNAEAYFNRVAEVSDIVVMGNHEAVLVDQCDLKVFNENIRPDINKAKSQLETTSTTFLGRLHALPRSVRIGSAVATHASFNPDDPWRHVRYIEGVQTEAPYLKSGINFLAHGHVPFIAWQEGGLWYYQRQIYEEPFELEPDTTYVINSGSVLGSREMRAYERTFIVFNDQVGTITFYNLEDI